jgi:hypothetical protein
LDHPAYGDRRVESTAVGKYDSLSHLYFPFNFS